MDAILLITGGVAAAWTAILSCRGLTREGRDNIVKTLATWAVVGVAYLVSGLAGSAGDAVVNKAIAPVIIAALVSAAAAIGTTAYAGVSQSNARKKAKKELERQRLENADYFNRNYSDSYLNRSDVQEVLKNFRDQMKGQNDHLASTAKITGATPEAVAAAKASSNKVFSDVYSSIASRGSMYKDTLWNNYVNRGAGTGNAMIGMHGQEQQSAANLMSNGMKGIGSSLDSIANHWDEFKKKNKEEE